MPTYEYRCPEGHEFERFYRKMSDAAADLPCPECGKTAVRQLSGGAGLVFKGSGFYLTDYGKNAHRKGGSGSGGEGASKGDAKSDAKGEGSGSASKSEKTESKSEAKSSSDSKSGSSSSSSDAKPASSPSTSSSSPKTDK